ncbi:DEKNAAC105121 [Brettanomyces naardenensis]|uniref:DEKNAAC105121 n=1 Tax=Brettanomyces naardenensis TaxID=13370 RepID=A0A448YT34_BRENA|nr:DEKNAAC105121 [Brettanomyces naardenensis]
MSKVATVGAGHIGEAVARVSVHSGHQVLISNSRSADTLKHLAKDIGAKAGTTAEAVKFGDIVLLAIPLYRVKDLDASLFKGKIVIDANNYYPSRDGHIPVLDAKKTTSTGYVEDLLPGARLVKTFNSIFAGDIAVGKQKLANGHKRALPIAGDDKEAKKAVTELLESIGYDVYDYGGISDSWRQEPNTPTYTVASDLEELKKLIGEAKR